MFASAIGTSAISKFSSQSIYSTTSVGWHSYASVAASLAPAVAALSNSMLATVLMV